MALHFLVSLTRSPRDSLDLWPIWGLILDHFWQDSRPWESVYFHDNQHHRRVCLSGDILQHPSGGIGKKRKGEGEREADRKNKERLGGNIMVERRWKVIRYGSITSYSLRYTYIFCSQKDFEEPLYCDYYLFLFLFLIFALKFPAPWLLSICFIGMKVPLGISIN